MARRPAPADGGAGEARRRPGRGPPGRPRAAGRRPPAGAPVDGRRPDPSPQLDEIEALAARRHVRVDMVSRRRLDAEARTDAPQGVVARAGPMSRSRSTTVPGARRPPPFLLVVAGVTDPRNLGALLRSAECAGVTGVVLPRHRAAHLTPTVAKVAAGAIEHLHFALVGGIPAALDRLTPARGLDRGPGRRDRPLALRPGPGRPGRWPWWSGARSGAWPRWSAPVRRAWWPSPSTARCRRSTSAWPAPWPASRWPASAGSPTHPIGRGDLAHRPSRLAPTAASMGLLRLGGLHGAAATSLLRRAEARWLRGSAVSRNRVTHQAELWQGSPGTVSSRVTRTTTQKRAGGGTRTHDLTITNRLRFQLRHPAWIRGYQRRCDAAPSKEMHQRSSTGALRVLSLPPSPFGRLGR